MASKETKHVQTELEDQDYDALRQLADERGLSLKQAVREALVDWIDRQQRADPTDPAFTVLEDLERDSLPASAETDARTESDIVDDEGDDEVALDLADDSRTHQDK